MPSAMPPRVTIMPNYAELCYYADYAAPMQLCRFIMLASSGMPKQPRTTHIIAERLFYATSGYQRMRAVTSDHKEGCRQGARLPATRQRAQGYCNQLGGSGRPGGPRRPPGAACMHWDLPACLPAAARRRAAGCLACTGFACMHESCWLAVTLSQITVKVSQLRLRSAEA